MSDLVRVSISLERSLLDQLEAMVASSGYTNRSEFVRDMIRQQLVDREWADDKQEVVGTITLLYDHHVPQLSEKLIDIQHETHSDVLATTHLHLSHSLCAEMTMLRGRSGRIRHTTERLRKQRGVLHATLSMSSVSVATGR